MVFLRHWHGPSVTGSQPLPGPAAAGHGRTVRCPLSAARVGAARGWAAAEFGLCPATAPDLGPWRPVRVGSSSPAG